MTGGNRMLRWIFTNWSANKELHFNSSSSCSPFLIPPQQRRASSTFHTRRLVDEILAKLNVFSSFAPPRPFPSSAWGTHQSFLQMQMKWHRRPCFPFLIMPEKFTYLSRAPAPFNYSHQVTVFSGLWASLNPLRMWTVRLCGFSVNFFQQPVGENKTWIEKKKAIGDSMNYWKNLSFILRCVLCVYLSQDYQNYCWCSL